MKKITSVLIIAVFAITSFSVNGQVTMEICKGNGEKCEAEVQTSSGTIKVKSVKTKGSASVIITQE